MNTYIVTYDLRKSRDYESLYKAIKSYKWAYVLESVWCIVTSDSAKDIRDYLKGFMDNDDGLFVIKSGTEAAWSNVECSNAWLKDNL